MSASEDEEESTATDLSVNEEGEPEFNLGLYLGGRNQNLDRHGRGWAILPNGDQYDGQYRRGRRHGCGLYVFKGGARYYGNYRCGVRTGRGMFIYPDGSVYEGHWRRNVRHGKGRYTYANGDSYAGDWYKGLRHGVGIYTFSCIGGQRNVRFKGTWQMGERIGPFQVFYGNDDKNVILHGNWDRLYPQGPAVFSFGQNYMLMGFFQAPEEPMRRGIMDVEGIEEGEEEMRQDFSALDMVVAPKWYAQDISLYDYSQLPQEPVPLPISDSELSVCSLSTEPSEVTLVKSISYVDEAEEEGEGEFECVPECECSVSMSTDSTLEPCAPTMLDPCGVKIPDPCGIEISALSKPYC